MSGEAAFELTAADNVRAMHTHTGRLARWIAFLVFDIGLFVAAFDLYRRTSLFADWKLWLIAGISLFLLFWDLVLRDAIVRRQFRQSRMRSPLNMRWDDEALSIDTDAGKERFEWSRFYRWMTSKTTLLLYRDAGFFIAIPRRAVGDQGIDDMIAALKAAGVRQR